MPRHNRQSGSFMRWHARKHNRLTTRNWREAMRAATLALCFHAIISLSASGQSAATRLSDFQSWDELDVSARLAKNVDVSWISEGRFSTQFGNPATYFSGAEATIGIGSHLLVAPSYYYLAYRTTAGQSGHFHIPMLAATLKVARERWTVSDRNRFLGAIGGGNDFWLYLNRPRVDYTLGSPRWGTSAFLWDEVFYFSVFHKWTRNRSAAGVRKAIHKNWAVDLYYLRQDDSKLQPRVINGVGATLELRIR
jgi:hypothetical protein